MDRTNEKPGTTIEGDTSLFKPLEIDKKLEHTEGVDNTHKWWFRQKYRPK
jgi:hypothetical protein